MFFIFSISWVIWKLLYHTRLYQSDIVKQDYFFVKHKSKLSRWVNETETPHPYITLIFFSQGIQQLRTLISTISFCRIFFFFSTYHWGSHYFFAKSVTDRDKVKIFFSLLKSIYWTFILACRNAPRKGRVKKEHLWLYKDNLQFHGTLTLSELSPLIIPACS